MPGTYRRMVITHGRLTEVPIGEENTGLNPATYDHGQIVENGTGPSLIYKEGMLWEVTDETLII